jgi:hypothetical protein
MARDRVRLPPLPLALVLASAVSIGSSVPVEAHEPGTTRVIANFTADRTYTIELTTDAPTLLARLEVARKQPRSSPATIADYRRGFAALCDEIGRHLDASFDGTPVLVAPTCTVDDAVTGPEPSLASLGVTVRFDGPIPAGASHFTWQYELTYATYALTIVSSDGSADETLWLEGGQVSPVALLDRLAVPIAHAVVAGRSFRLGFTRFLPNGLGQVLFVLGMVLLNRRPSSILWQVGAFTFAHSIALALTRYGLLSLSSSVVQPLIVLSVIYLACDNLVSPELRLSRIMLICLFGLIHGIALADALGPGTLIRSPLPGDLFWFNVGIEAAQLALIVGTCVVVGGWSQRERHRQLVVVPASALMALIGLMWILHPIPL